MESFIPMLSPIVGVIGAVIIALLSIKHKSKKIFDALAIVFSLLVLVMVSMTAYIVVYGGKIIVYCAGGWIPPLGITYIVDKFSALMGLLSSLVFFMVILYSTGYFKEEGNGIHYYYVLVLLLQSALLGIYYTGDIFNMFVMIEMMAVAAYALVAYHKNKGEAIEASLKYGMVACLAGLLLFIGLGFTYGYMGTLSIPDLAAKVIGVHTAMDVFSGVPPSMVSPILLIIGLIIWSFLLESAVFPLHFWLPDAHSEAPAPVSALLSGLVVNAGLYGLTRIMYTVLDTGENIVQGTRLFLDLLIYTAMLGAIYSAVMMITQRDVKRIIAYSTVMHVALVVIGLGLGSKAGLTASIYHILTHSFSKSLAFLSIGLLVAAAGSRNIYDLKGFARFYPGAVAGAIISMLGLAGMPPLGTFPSKLLLITACIDAGNYLAAAAIIVSSALAAIAYFRIIHYLVNEPPTKTVHMRIKWSTTIILGILSIIVILVGLFLPIIYPYIYSTATDLFNPYKYIESVYELLAKYGLP